MTVDSNNIEFLLLSDVFHVNPGGQKLLLVSPVIKELCLSVFIVLAAFEMTHTL